MSEVLTDTENIQNICSFIVDTLDGQQTIKFIIEVNDDPDASDTVDYYSTSSGHWYYHTVNIPYSDSCSYDGGDDYGSEIDREQSYSISIVS